MKARLCIDNAVGEYRRALVDEDGRAFRLEIERWSERGRPHLGEIWWGRARARMKRGNAWFVDIGLGVDGVMETTAAITEGAMIPVRVKSEAWADKGPTLSLADMAASAPKPERPGLHAKPEEDAFLAGVEIVGAIDDRREARRTVDAALEDALATEAAIPGGGVLRIDYAPALASMDVDSAGRRGSEGERFDVDLNRAAADEAARQVALRGLGGVVVIDFVTMKRRQDQERVVERFRSQLAARLGRASQVLEISAVGLCQVAVARRARPVLHPVAAAAGTSEALDALRMIESAGWDGPQRIEAVVSREAAAWLEKDEIGWKAALADRIGARWAVRPDDRPPGRADVRSVS